MKISPLSEMQTWIEKTFPHAKINKFSNERLDISQGEAKCRVEMNPVTKGLKINGVSLFPKVIQRQIIRIWAQHGYRAI